MDYSLQAPPSMGFSRQEYWSGLPFPSLEDLLDPGIEPGSLALQADSLPSEPLGKGIYIYIYDMNVQVCSKDWTEESSLMEFRARSSYESI